jgi:carboxymethylenebutenolidase
MMTTIAGRAGAGIPTFVAEPPAGEPWPGVVVVHDALGMTEDLRRQAQWLADSGFLAAAPNLFQGNRIRCLIRTMREMSRGTDGPTFQDIAAVQAWLKQQPRCTGRVGIIGFCMGGGFALLLAPNHGYAASSVNYGGTTEEGWNRLADACPIVASYGGADRTLKGAAARLERILTEHGVPHDVKEYPGVGHSFLNDHDPSDVPWIFRMLMTRMPNIGYDAAAAGDAKSRIVAFFNAHLGGSLRR